MKGRFKYLGWDLVGEGRCVASVIVQTGGIPINRQCRNTKVLIRDAEGEWCQLHSTEAYAERASRKTKQVWESRHR